MTPQLPGPDRPVPYSLTPKAEAALAMPEPEPGPYPTFDDDPARWGLKLPGPQTAAGLEAEAALEFWGPEGPYGSYAEYLADGRREPDPEAEP
jgi:hypothetical protein